MADLEERLRVLAPAQVRGEDHRTIVEAADHISAQTQTISDLTRALEEIQAAAERAYAIDGSGQLSAYWVRDKARAALSSARSVSTTREEKE